MGSLSVCAIASSLLLKNQINCTSLIVTSRYAKRIGLRQKARRISLRPIGKPWFQYALPFGHWPLDLFHLCDALDLISKTIYAVEIWAKQVMKFRFGEIDCWQFLCRARLERFFIKYDPKYASKVEELLKEYHGNERLLFTRLRREYRHVLRPKKQM